MAIQSSIHTIKADKDLDQERGEKNGIMRLSGTKIAPASMRLPKYRLRMFTMDCEWSFPIFPASIGLARRKKTKCHQGFLRHRNALQ